MNSLCTIMHGMTSLHVQPWTRVLTPWLQHARSVAPGSSALTEYFQGGHQYLGRHALKLCGQSVIEKRGDMHRGIMQACISCKHLFPALRRPPRVLLGQTQRPVGHSLGPTTGCNRSIQGWSSTRSDSESSPYQARLPFLRAARDPRIRRAVSWSHAYLLFPDNGQRNTCSH